MVKGLISIITPAYNAAPFIRETIDSVRAQSYENWEMIIADDGSTDGTIEAANMATGGDSRIHIKTFPHSGLPSICRNRGLRYARGEFVAFLDSDDLWEHCKLERQLASLKANAKRWGFSNTRWFGDDQGLNYNITWSPSTPFFNELLTGNGIPCLTIITEMQLLASICKDNDPGMAFDESRSLKAGEDWDLALRLSQFAEPDYIPEPLARYRIHSRGISRSFEKNHNLAMALIDKYRKSGTDETLLSQATDWHNSKLAINRMLYTDESWRYNLFRSTTRHAMKLRNLFFALLPFLPKWMARKAYYFALSRQKGSVTNPAGEASAA